jgi:hypothetical protein
MQSMMILKAEEEAWIPAAPAGPTAATPTLWIIIRGTNARTWTLDLILKTIQSGPSIQAGDMHGTYRESIDIKNPVHRSGFLRCKPITGVADVGRASTLKLWTSTTATCYLTMNYNMCHKKFAVPFFSTTSWVKSR